MKTTETKTKFELGSVYITPGATEAINQKERAEALHRHSTGDWGEVPYPDHEENELSLREGYRLFSVYRTQDGVKFWVITEADRSSTTMLLPEEY